MSELDVGIEIQGVEYCEDVLSQDDSVSTEEN